MSALLWVASRVAKLRTHSSRRSTKLATSFHVHLNEAERRVSVDCGLVLPTNQSPADGLDDRFVRRALHVHVAHMTVLVDFDSAGNLPVPARDGRFHGIDCAADIVTSRPAGTGRNAR
jgi:hypothetical protein